MLNLKALLSAGLIWLAPGLAYAQTACVSDWMREAVPISGFVFGENIFAQSVSADLVFTLQPNRAGWHVQMQSPGETNIPTRIRPRGIPPQTHIIETEDGPVLPTYEYIFGAIMDPATNPELIVPSGASPNAATVQPAIGSQGLVSLAVTHHEFSNGLPPRMSFMEFSACVSWNTGPREPDDAHYGDLGAPGTFANWVVTGFEDCGLEPRYLLSDRIATVGIRQRAWLETDIDGDTRADLVAMVTGTANGETQLAICQQAGKTLTLLGTEAGFEDGYLDMADWWSAEGPDITIGIEGASSVRLNRSEDGTYSVAWEGD